MTLDFSPPTFVRGLPLAAAALEFAAGRHRGQRRESDDAAFIVHPLEVAALLFNTGHPEHVVAAGMLHDTLEDTSATDGEVRERFGAQVADLVAAMTEDAGIADFAERKAALREQIAAFGPEATDVYAADKVAKVRELRARAIYDRRILDGEAGPKLDHYRQSLEMLEAVSPEQPLVRQLRFELEALDSLPPGSV